MLVRGACCCSHELVKGQTCLVLMLVVSVPLNEVSEHLVFIHNHVRLSRPSRPLHSLERSMPLINIHNLVHQLLSVRARRASGSSIDVLSVFSSTRIEAICFGHGVCVAEFGLLQDSLELAMLVISSSDIL